MKDVFNNFPPVGTRVSNRDVEVDLAKYQSFIDDPSLTPEQREDVIKTIWSIIINFVDLGFGVHPMQEVCGKDDTDLDHSGVLDSDSNTP
jgi:hypothetical protein